MEDLIKDIQCTVKIMNSVINNSDNRKEMTEEEMELIINYLDDILKMISDYKLIKSVTED